METRLKTFDLQPHLVGDLVELRPLRPDDWQELFRVASDPLIWEQHPACDRYTEEVFREFFREALKSRGALVVVDRQTRKIVGSSRYFGFNPQQSQIEIGWTFLARSHWGGRYNREMKRLMLSHAFQFIDSVVFLVGADNVRSRKAVEKIGGIITDRHETRIMQGKSVDHVVYQVKRPATDATSTCAALGGTPSSAAAPTASTSAASPAAPSNKACPGANSTST